MSVSRGAEPKVLLVTRDHEHDAIALCRRFAAALASPRLDLARSYGVFVEPWHGIWGVYLGRHDGGEIRPDDSAVAAAMKIHNYPAQHDQGRQ